MDKEQELRPKQWVLVRDDDDQVWSLDIFSHFVDGVPYPYNCIGDAYAQCIPYRGNEKLLNTSDAPEVKWEPKNGDFIAFGNGQSKVLGIYKERHTDVRLAFFDYVDYYDGKMQYFTWAWLGSKLRPATDEEKESFLSKLHEIGKDWNAEEKKIVDYKEPYVPKDGDFVHNDGDFYESVFIMRGTIHNNAFLTNGGMSRKQGDTNREWEVMPYKRLTFRGWNPRPATEDEKKELLRILGEMGKIWDEDEKEIKDIEWKPAEGEIFYYVEFSPCDFAFFADFRTFHSDDEQCKGHIEKGNYYRTIREAEYEANQLNEKNNMIFEK